VVKIGDYCKYCGSSDLEKVKYEVKDTNSTKTSKYIGVTHFIKAGEDKSSEGKIENTIYRDTYYCNACKKIDCLCNLDPSVGPLKIIASDDFNYNIIIPAAFQEVLKQFHVDGHNLTNLIYELVNKKGVKKYIKEFVQSGKNECKNHELGYNSKIKIGNQNISIHILMEMKNGMLLRIIYDGGKSIC